MAGQENWEDLTWHRYGATSLYYALGQRYLTRQEAADTCKYHGATLASLPSAGVNTWLKTGVLKEIQSCGQ